MSTGSNRQGNLPVNEAIEAAEVLLIDLDGTNMGVVSLDKALQHAARRDMDLVQMSGDTTPFPCRIMDYGRFVFNRKKERAVSQHQRRAQVKEIKFRIGTGRADYAVKLRKLREMLMLGYKTKITLRFRGREMYRPELGSQLLSRVCEDLSDIANIDQEPTMERRQLSTVLSLKRGVRRSKVKSRQGDAEVVNGKVDEPVGKDSSTRVSADANSVDHKEDTPSKLAKEKGKTVKPKKATNAGTAAAKKTTARKKADVARSSAPAAKQKQKKDKVS